MVCTLQSTQLSRFGLIILSLCSLLVSLLMMSSPSFAANWLKLQGLEPNAAAGRVKVWGFVQGQYQHDFSQANANNQYTPAKLIGPNLISKNMFNVNRARIGIRGTGFPKDRKANYFLLAEFGNNGITSGLGNARLTDASVTFSYIPYVLIRGGLFKYPGSEEGLQAIHVTDYINFSRVTNQLMLERFPNDDNFIKDTTGTRGNTEAQTLGTAPNGFEKPVGAFRDVGVQFFNFVNWGDWEHTWAIMAGNGNGLNAGDNNGNKSIYYYWASEKVYDGKGGRREGLKIFFWYQSGKRSYDENFSNAKDISLTGDAGGTTATDIIGQSSGQRNYFFYNRKRGGLGLKYLRKPFRVSFEWISGQGMIFLGPHKESFDMNVPGGNGNGLISKANGWYLDGGWYIPDTNWVLDFRYDAYNRLTGDALEVNFKTITLGVQYFLNKKTRLTFNYEKRNAQSATENANLEANFAGFNDRLAVQFTAVY